VDGRIGGIVGIEAIIELLQFFPEGEQLIEIDVRNSRQAFTESF